MTKSRREREHELHRQQILEAAESVFSAYGFEGTSIEMIAKKAEFSVGSIYNFYKNKADLFRQVFLSLANRRVEKTRTAVEPFLGKPWEALRALVGEWVRYFVEHGDFLRTAMAAIMAGGSTTRAEEPPPSEFLSAFLEYRQIVRDLFADLLKTPEARPLPLKTACMVFEGTALEFLKAVSHDSKTFTRLPAPPDSSVFADQLYLLLCEILKK